MLGNKLVFAVQGVEVQQMPGLAQHLAALIQLAHGHAHVVQFGVIGEVDDLLRRQRDTVHLRKGGEKDDRDRSR